MDKDHLNEALEQISDDHLTEAAAAKKRRRVLPWIAAIAAVLALVLVLRALEAPMFIQAQAVTLASENRAMARPDYDSYTDKGQWSRDLDAWMTEREQRSAFCAETLEVMQPFLKDTCAEFLTGSENNLLFSPVNAYIGLAAAAELTAGSTRQQLLTLLGTRSLDALRTQVSALWESVHRNDGQEISTLATSLWLDSKLNVNQTALDALAYHHYCSVYSQDLSSPQASKDIGAWLSNNTGGFLKQYTDSYQLPAGTILALYSTIYFQSKWQDEFHATNNSQMAFHSPSGDRICTFMNAKLRHMDYYWGDSFGAVSLWLKNGSRMWFILPDEGKTTDDVLLDGQYIQLVTASDSWENSKYMKVNLSVPKFDVHAKAELANGLKKLGVTDLFDPAKANFSASLQEPAFLTAVNQAVRVEIDEKGVTAAAYLELPGAGAAMPPEEIMDFVLDRPFVFVITGADQIPLFAGTVNRPA